MAERSKRQVKKNQDLQRILHIEKERSRMRMIRKILKKPGVGRTEDENKVLDEAPELVEQIQSSIKKLVCLKERMKEVADEPEVLSAKCEELAKALTESKYTVLYTGAGISTSAEIPDYRGPDGVWTLLQKGKEVVFKDLSLAEPTFTHMAIQQMFKEGLISHVVSQNCDGLHLRSGLPKAALSELHGNMFIEVCPKCKPLKQYTRLFDVTERTGLHRHKTGRFCKNCKTELKDTIVHFGEKGTLSWPMNWKGAIKAASKADVILCLGTSLKVLRRYPGLWNSNKSCKPKLIIVNLQWTPKDTQATLKINGKCDDVMKLVASFLKIKVPNYEKSKDPIFNIATPLSTREESTTSRLLLTKNEPEENDKARVKNETKNNIEKAASSESEKLDLVKLLENPESQYKLQPRVELHDISSGDALLSCNIEKMDSVTYHVKDEDSNGTNRTSTKLSGWYGKGCAKWKKRKRRSSLASKRLKIELDNDSLCS